MPLQSFEVTCTNVVQWLQSDFEKAFFPEVLRVVGIPGTDSLFHFTKGCPFRPRSRPNVSLFASEIVDANDVQKLLGTRWTEAATVFPRPY